MKLKSLLADLLTERQLCDMPTSFDVVGDILIFSEFPESLKAKERKIAERILATYPNIKVVCRKARKYSGGFRTPTLRILGGKRRKETVHKENGIRVKLHAEKVYFSPRLSTERERINKLVRPGEDVLVMFSGCGVYPVNISKNTEAKEIYGVEINPVAHAYALENLTLNKAKNIRLYQGDVNSILPKIKKAFDHVLMPLPKSAEDFLGIALKKVKRGGTLHFYDFLHETEFAKAGEKLRGACRKAKRDCTLLRTVKCGQYAPGVFRICVDARIG